MVWTDKIRQVKIALVGAAVLIAAASLVVSHFLVRDLAREERQRMEIWAEAMHTLSQADEETDLNLVLKVIEQNNTIPVIVVDAAGEVQTYRNVKLHGATGADSTAEAAQTARRMLGRQQAIRVQIGEGRDDYLLVCYDDSLLLTRLAWYPYIQLGVVMLFVVVAIFALLTSKRAEQNKVWVGLSKETAHQLGTPISSLMAWTEILHETYPDDTLIPEMDKDVKRLQLIADRFSKIGSAPERTDVSLHDILQNVVEYMNRRTSQHVSITFSMSDPDCKVMVNRQLFEWVFENLCKNAVDAMSGSGSITITARQSGSRCIIDVSDTGKGIERGNIKNVFRPGFTTKKRGWGLGLSLARRIIEEYHHGRIYVLRSEVGAGTTFRIEV
ncbi:MAG: HAMP domain-containing histidine kinase [Prevotella sp.]|nr:HAMP domain-containing histidine kinase [Prevotella sp.]MBR6191361.1 HAMP domain-containing histidine kinase [Prevotella sp.]